MIVGIGTILFAGLVYSFFSLWFITRDNNVQVIDAEIAQIISSGSTSQDTQVFLKANETNEIYHLFLGVKARKIHYKAGEKIRVYANKKAILNAPYDENFVSQYIAIEMMP